MQSLTDNEKNVLLLRLWVSKLNIKTNTKIFLTLFVLASTFSLGAFAAKYKVNTGGKVTSSSGKTQYSSVLNTSGNIYNNYNSQNYVNSQQVLMQPIGTIDIVMDYSGSMAYWINESKKTMSSIIAQLPATVSVGFRVFGHNSTASSSSPIIAKVKSITKKENGSYKVTTTSSTPSFLGHISGYCAATKQVVPVAPNSAATLLKGMNSVDIGGSTPLTYALSQAVNQDFNGLAKNYPKKIILITDGVENCGGNPCAFAEDLIKKRKDITIDVVLVSAFSQELKCLADKTGGNFYTPADVSSFSSSIYQSITNTKQQPTIQQAVPEQKYEYVDN